MIEYEGHRRRLAEHDVLAGARGSDREILQREQVDSLAHGASSTNRDA
jgi:hypothetical protein